MPEKATFKPEFNDVRFEFPWDRGTLMILYKSQLQEFIPPKVLAMGLLLGKAKRRKDERSDRSAEKFTGLTKGEQKEYERSVELED